jgi:hypothetical protein
MLLLASPSLTNGRRRALGPGGVKVLLTRRISQCPRVWPEKRVPRPALIIRPCGDALGTQGLRVADRFLGELHTGRQAELGVDVGEMGLHSPG